MKKAKKKKKKKEQTKYITKQNILPVQNQNKTRNAL